MPAARRPQGAPGRADRRAARPSPPSATPASTRRSPRCATQMRRFAEAEVLPHAHEWHLKNEYIPLEVIAKLGRARRVRPDHPRGVRRPRPRQGGDVRRLRGAVARLHRRRLARHALGDRRRADPRRRHRGAEAEVPAEDRLRRDAADRRVHRAQHRLRPRLAQDARGAGGRRLQGHGPEDLDHASRARRPDDAAGAHRSERAGLQGPLHAAGREAARHATPIRSRPRACPAARSRCSAIAA